MAFNKPLQHFSSDDIQVIIAKINMFTLSISSKLKIIILKQHNIQVYFGSKKLLQDEKANDTQ